MASGTRIVPMLVQSCLDAFLATVVEVKDSLRASPRVLFRCYFSSRPTSRSSLALVPLVVRSVPPILEDFPGRHTAVAPRLPRIGPIYILRRLRVESLPFVLLHFCITTPLYDVATLVVVCVLLGNFTSLGKLN